MRVKAAKKTGPRKASPPAIEFVRGSAPAGQVLPALARLLLQIVATAEAGGPVQSAEAVAATVPNANGVRATAQRPGEIMT